LADTTLQIICFAVDHAGELLVMDYAGTIHRLIANPARGKNSNFPRTLSETGLFASVKEHRPAAGVVPYAIAAESWADHTTAQRFIALPGNSQIKVANAGTWQFPQDTVLVKTISLELRRGVPTSKRRLETQILYRGEQEWLSIGIGVTNLIFTFVGLWLIDRLGRRTLLYIGSFGYIASLGLCAWAFFTENYTIVPACILAFIAAHAVGQGAVIWVFISEIFPNRHRAQGQSLGSFTHWFFAALLTLFFPSMVTLFEPGYVFGFFCFMMVLQLVWVKAMVPETKGRPLEQIEHELGMTE